MLPVGTSRVLGDDAVCARERPLVAVRESSGGSADRRHATNPVPSAGKEHHTRTSAIGACHADSSDGLSLTSRSSDHADPENEYPDRRRVPRKDVTPPRKTGGSRWAALTEPVNQRASLAVRAVVLVAF